MLAVRIGAKRLDLSSTRWSTVMAPASGESSACAVDLPGACLRSPLTVRSGVTLNALELIVREGALRPGSSLPGACRIIALMVRPGNRLPDCTTLMLDAREGTDRPVDERPCGAPLLTASSVSAPLRPGICLLIPLMLRVGGPRLPMEAKFMLAARIGAERKLSALSIIVTSPACGSEFSCDLPGACLRKLPVRSGVTRRPLALMVRPGRFLCADA